MAKRKDIGEELKSLRNEIQERRVVIGTERVMKEIKAKKLKKVFVANNCPQRTKDDVQYYVELTGIQLVELAMNNEELGVFCKKNFFVSVLGIRGA